MPASAFDGIMTQSGIPALLRILGIPATHTNAALDESAATIILKTEAVAVGEYGERMEPRTTVQIPSASGAVVGDTFTVAGPTVWTAVQLLSDDGYFRRFAVRSAT